MSDEHRETKDTKTEEPAPFDPDDVIGYIEGQPPPDPNAGWLKRLWYKLTGAI